MQPTRYLKKAVHVLFVLIFVACSKGEEGQEGPQGPQGEQGISGETGQPGIVAYFYSDWLPVEFPNPLTTINTAISFEAPNVTNEDLDNGVVIGYARLISGEVVQLPYFVPDIEQEYSISIAPGIIRIFASRGGPGSSVIPIVESLRYIVVPGTVEENGLSKEELSNLGYEEAKDFFEILQ